jgi:hypothetical protein
VAFREVVGDVKGHGFFEDEVADGQAQNMQQSSG